MIYRKTNFFKFNIFIIRVIYNLLTKILYMGLRKLIAA
jgi:hypothetical protein